MSITGTPSSRPTKRVAALYCSWIAIISSYGILLLKLMKLRASSDGFGLCGAVSNHTCAPRARPISTMRRKLCS